MALTFDLSSPKRLLRAAGEVGCIQCFQYSQGMGHRLPDVQQPPHRTTGLLLGLHSYYTPAKEEEDLPEVQQGPAGRRCPGHPVSKKKGANVRGTHRSSCARCSPPSHKAWEHDVGVPQAEHKQGVCLQQGPPVGCLHEGVNRG